MSPQLDAIWRQIQHLDEADRLALELRLHDLADAQCRQQSAADGEQHKAGWRAVYGAADPKEIAELQQIIDREFSEIDPEGWS